MFVLRGVEACFDEFDAALMCFDFCFEAWVDGFETGLRCLRLVWMDLRLV